MKKKFLLPGIVMMLCMFVVFSLSASAYSNQWIIDGTSKSYYNKSGAKLKGGPHTINKKKYLFTSDGTLITNKATYYNKKVYVSTSSGALLTKWGKVNGQYYYGTSAGNIKTGLVKYKTPYYYFSPTTGKMAVNQWLTINKKTYYFQNTGRAARNKIYTINGEKYYFNSKAELAKGVTKVGKYYYGFGSTTGKMLYGWNKIGKNRYYFDSKTGRAATGWKTIGGKKYYFNNLGAQQTGWLVLKNKRYYLDPKADGAMTTGKKTISGKTYNFGTKGYVTYKSTGNYKIQVNRSKNVVTIYDGNTPIKAMTCSTGVMNGTPLGTFFIRDHLAWWSLNGPSMGQYCSHFLDEYLFHSVPAYGTSRNPYGISAHDFNNLGKQASGGCIRLCVADAKWIYYNIPIGTPVTISTTAATPLGKPDMPKMKEGTKGLDPTDDLKNPAGYDVKIK